MSILRTAAEGESNLIRPPQTGLWEKFVNTCRFALHSLNPTAQHNSSERYPCVMYNETIFRLFAHIRNPKFIQEPRFPDSEDALVKGGRPWQIVKDVFGSENVITCPAQGHKRFRKHAASFFSSRHIKTLATDIMNMAEKQTANWGSGSINVSKEIPKFTAGVIAKHGIGYEGPIEPVVHAVEEVMRHAALRLLKAPSLLQRAHQVAMRMLSHLFGWDLPLTETEALSFIEDCVHQSLSDHKTNDQSYIQKMEKDNELFFTQEELASTAKMLFFAGQETTKSALVWAIYQLGLHPKWQDDVFQEWKKAQQNGMDEKTFIHSNRILKAIINEVLRLNPPVYKQSREANRDLVLEDEENKYFIPKGTALIFSHYLHQRDPELWGPHAALFDPERFLEGPKDPGILFGAGNTSCLGNKLALLEMQSFLFKLICQCEWKAVDPNVQQRGMITLTTDRDVYIDITARKSV